MNYESGITNHGQNGKVFGLFNSILHAPFRVMLLAGDEV